MTTKRDDDMKEIKWGILGAGWIANCFAHDFHRVEDSRIAAVAARDQVRAEAFADKYGIPQAYGSYDELVNDPEVDVVYVATTHNFHLDHVRLCLEHGKHVLCEKPATVNASQFARMAALAREKGLFLMEAMWTAFLPAIRTAQQWIADGLIGDVRCVQADLGFALDLIPERRNINLDLAAGTILDLLIYPLSFGRIFSGSAVGEYQIMANKHYSGADSDNYVQMRYVNGVMGQYSASSCDRMHNDGIIVGTRGRIVVNDFHMAKTAHLLNDDMEQHFHDKMDDVVGYNFEIQHVVDCLRDGLTESPVMPLSVTAAMMELMDDMRARISLRYPCE